MIVFEKSKGLTDVRTHYCPGCMHGNFSENNCRMFGRA